MEKMADDEESILKAKLEEAADYDERARIRRQLRELKKKKNEVGEPSSFKRKGSAAYRRFSGVTVDQKATTSSSKSSTLPVKVFGKLGTHPETSRTPSPSGSESSYKSTSRTSLKAVSPTQISSETPPRKISQPQSTGSEEEAAAAVNGASSPTPPQDAGRIKPGVDEVQPELSPAVEGREKEGEVCSGQEEEKEMQPEGNVVEVHVEEVEEEREEVSPPEQKAEEEGMDDTQLEETVKEEQMKDLPPEEKIEEEKVEEETVEEETVEEETVEEERVKEAPTDEMNEEEKEIDVQPSEEDVLVKESQSEEKVEEERETEAQPEEKVEVERKEESQTKEAVKEERVKDIQPEEKVITAVGKEETDFHFRRRAKTEVRPKPSPAAPKAAEFQGFKLKKAVGRETKETKPRPEEKAAEFLAFQLKKVGSAAQKKQGAVESASQPTFKPARPQGSEGRGGSSSVWKAGEAKTTESQPATKTAGFQGFQGRKVDSSAQKAREAKETDSQPATKAPGFQAFQDRKVDSSAQKGRETKQPATKQPAPKAAEFQGFQLRKTETSTTRSRAQTWGVSAKPAVRKPPVILPKVSDAKELTVAELDSCLDQFVNRVFKFPTNGRPLSTFCKDPRVLCNWINQAVPGTVDLRALTVAKDKRAEEFAREENMTLAAESARAIGCRIMDDTEQRLLNGDTSVSRQLVMDLVKARAVNLPGMRDAPEGTFQDPSLLFAIFEIGPAATHEATDGSSIASKPLSTTSARTAAIPESGSSTVRDDYRHGSMSSKPVTTFKQPVATSKEPSAASKRPVPASKEPVITSKEPVATSKPPPDRSTPSSSAAPDKESGGSLKSADISDMTDLSYEERAALRRAAREKRKQERAALAAKS